MDDDDDNDGIPDHIDDDDDGDGILDLDEDYDVCTSFQILYSNFYLITQRTFTIY